MKFRRRATCSLCGSVILSTSGLCFIFLWPTLFNCALSLQCNPVLFQLWKNLPLDIVTEFYFFNWTNPEDIHNASIKPKFEEIGPYVFYQKEEKCDIVWNDNGTVTFKLRRFWYYDEKTKNRSLQDKITTLDLTMLGISYVSRTWNYYFRKGVFLSLTRVFTSVHSTHTARELLFDGYPQPFIKIASVVPFLAHPETPSWSRFGWVYDRNGSSEFDGVLNMGTGTNSVLGKIYNWNYESKTSYFEGSCGKVSGTTGQVFPRNLAKDSVEIFSTDMRRTVSFKFVKETRVNGILGYQYTAGDYMFDNGTIDAKNGCFCTGDCVPSGVANFSVTRYDSPLFMSLPHFYGADPYYVNLVDGLEPVKQKHEFSITIEPVTGVVLEANPKLQANLLIQPVPGTQLFDDAPKVFFPVIWAQQRAKIPNRETLVLKIVLAIPAVSVSLGVVMIVISIGLLFYEGVLFQKRFKKLKEGGETVPLR